MNTKKTIGCLAAAVCAAVGCPGGEPFKVEVKEGEPLTAVRDRVRQLPDAAKSNGVEIVLAPGEYLLPEGIAFTKADSGVSSIAPVVWRAAAETVRSRFRVSQLLTRFSWFRISRSMRVLMTSKITRCAPIMAIRSSTAALSLK